MPDPWQFQIQYPSKYLVTSDSMLEDFRTQGGMAPPRLTLTIGRQPVPGNPSWWDLLAAPDQDCIAIWSTRGFPAVTDWEINSWPQPLGSPHLATTEKVAIGRFTAELRQVSFSGNQTRWEAYIKLAPILSSDITYFFNTGATTSKADLLTVLQNFAIRSVP